MLAADGEPKANASIASVSREAAAAATAVACVNLRTPWPAKPLQTVRELSANTVCVRCECVHVGRGGSDTGPALVARVRHLGA